MELERTVFVEEVRDCNFILHYDGTMESALKTKARFEELLGDERELEKFPCRFEISQVRGSFCVKLVVTANWHFDSQWRFENVVSMLRLFASGVEGDLRRLQNKIETKKYLAAHSRFVKRELKNGTFMMENEAFAILEKRGLAPKWAGEESISCVCPKCGKEAIVKCGSSKIACNKANGGCGFKSVFKSVVS